MTELMIEILGYIAIAALLGFLLGWLTWGWGHGDRISAARAEGAREARTSVDGSAGLRDQLRASAVERGRLETEIDRLTELLAAAELAAGLRADDAMEPGEDVSERGDDDGSVVSSGAGTPEASASDVRPPVRTPVRLPTPGPARSASANHAGGEAPDRLSTAEGRAGGGPGTAQRSGDSTGAPAAAGRPRRPAAAARGDTPRRADELAARLASYASPDVTLRKQIMSGAGAADRAATEPEADARGSGPAMPHPPAFTLRRQRVTGSDDPPVADEQVPPDTAQLAGQAAGGKAEMPRPAAGTRSQQRFPEGDGAPPLIDEQAPPLDGPAGEPGMPRPPNSTLRQQRAPKGAGESPVVDEQVPPLDGPAGEPEMPRPPTSTLREQRVAKGAGESPVVDEQVPPEPASGAGARPGHAAARPEPAAPASLLADQPAEVDDLRRIRGVGMVTERLLNRNGIWLYRQLVGLTPDETSWLAAVLDMPISRIERERWAEQAASLHRGKYGSAEGGRGG